VFRELENLRAEMGVRLIYIHLGDYGQNENLKNAAQLYINVSNTEEFKSMMEEILVQVSALMADD
jgi:hypothetical protein